MLGGSRAIVGCLGMFVFVIWFGVVGNKPRCRVSRSQFWVLGERWRGRVSMGEVHGGALWCGRRFVYC